MRTAKEIATKLLELYNSAKLTAEKDAPPAIPLESIRFFFGDELYAAAKSALNELANQAAGGCITLTSPQSLVLFNRKQLLVRQNLGFRESNDQMVRSMAGSEVIDAKFSRTPSALQPGDVLPDTAKLWDRVTLTKSDGVDEFEIFAPIPEPEWVVGSILWIQEPFMSEGRNGIPWSKMTKEERELFSKEGKIRQPSTMPKFMLSRRAKIDAIALRTDNRTAWIEYSIVEIEPFSRTEEEERAILEEFRPSALEIEESGLKGSTDAFLAPGEKLEITAGDTDSVSSVLFADDAPASDHAEIDDDELASALGIDPKVNPINELAEREPERGSATEELP